jgi:hypothetical protein
VSLVVAVLVVALLIGWARGGSLDRLGALPLRQRYLAVSALAAQVVGTLVGGPFFLIGLIVSGGLVLLFLSRNRGIRGTGLAALGLCANVLVIGANGAMPVSADAAGRAGVSVQSLLTGADARHRLAGTDTRLRQLGDVIPVPLPLRPEVVSPGDVLLAAGLAQLVTLGMLGAGTGDRSGRAGATPTPRVRPPRPAPPTPPEAYRPS